MTGHRLWLRRLGITVVLLLAALVNAAVLMTAYKSPSAAQTLPHSTRQSERPSVGTALAPASGQASGQPGIEATLASPAASSSSKKCTCKCPTRTGSPPVLTASSGSSQTPVLSGSPPAKAPEVPLPVLLGVAGMALFGAGMAGKKWSTSLQSDQFSHARIFRLLHQERRKGSPLFTRTSPAHRERFSSGP